MNPILEIISEKSGFRIGFPIISVVDIRIHHYEVCFVKFKPSPASAKAAFSGYTHV